MSSNKDTAKSQPQSRDTVGELFLVATPIGNLKDITLRALEVLKAVDAIACEDTRTSSVLLRHYGIRAPLSSYHTHNEAEATETLVAELVSGKRIALISDAGTPLLSDPGARLVAAAVRAGIRITPIPGASALLAAVTIAALPAEQFFYAGFLPPKAGARREALTRYRDIPATLVFYEAPHRLVAALEALAEAFGPRPASVARELTKLHEECRRGTLDELAAYYEAHLPRGECVILVHGADPARAMDDDGLDAMLREALATLRVKDAVAQVAKHAGRAKSDIYARALALKGEA
jgi:16S rRNA (cytidine1402-2'-O)-methyltransferase